MGWLLSFCVFLLSMMARAPCSDAWGKQGHYMVCKIAEQYLTERASSAVVDLLPPVAEGELASVCSWADQSRFRYRWASPLHYANTPGVCNFEYSRWAVGRHLRVTIRGDGAFVAAGVGLWKRSLVTAFGKVSITTVTINNFKGDCHNSKDEPDMCVVGAINNYTAQLLDYEDSSNGYNLTESIMFLAHFMGDVHQPMHVSFEDDEGGNTISVRWYRRKSNLHHVWDVNMIETAMRDFYERDRDVMIEAIKENITDAWSDEVSEWKDCQLGDSVTCADEYASESISLACDYGYKDVDEGFTLEDDYFLSRLPVVEKRIAQGGVRLAALLNRIFSKKVGGNPVLAE